MNPERILGGLIRMGLGRSVGMGTKTAIGMGALGVAMAAFDHFTNPEQGQVSAATTPYTSSQPISPSSCPPPPPPGMHTTPPTPPPAPKSVEDNNRVAILLIRAMIAASYADGQIDAEERKKILDRFEKVGLSSEERAFILQELLSPADLETIISEVNTPELAQEVYAISRMALEVDTEAERIYLTTLAQRLALDEETIQALENRLGLQ